jgi:hypothetical protein
MATGGPPQSITFAGREFAITADSDPTIKYGGFENDEEPNGDRTARMIKTPVTWAVTGFSVQIDTALEDQEFLQQAANNFADDVFTITLADDTVLQGRGQLTGELVFSPATAKAAVNFKGPGELTQQ